MLLGAAQVCDPFLQDRLLVLLDACECDAHAHIGEDKCDAAERRKCGAVVGDADANLRTFCRRSESIRHGFLLWPRQRAWSHLAGILGSASR